MNTSTSRKSLEEKVEELIRAEMNSIRVSVAAAVERGLSATAGSRRPSPQRRARPKVQNKRRTAEEVAELETRLMEVVTTTPGETMATLVAETGATARELRVPVVRLKKAGRLRLVGQRQYAKYFPGTVVSA